MTISLENVGSGFKRSVINDNFTAIQDEINNNLLDKAGGKALTADLDLNSNELLNAGNVGTSKITLNGTEITSTADLIGPQGPQGNTGPQGPQGIQGIQGVKGDTGTSYTVTEVGEFIDIYEQGTVVEDYSYLAVDYTIPQVITSAADEITVRIANPYPGVGSWRGSKDHFPTYFRTVYDIIDAAGSSVTGVENGDYVDFVFTGVTAAAIAADAKISLAYTATGSPVDLPQLYNHYDFLISDYVTTPDGSGALGSPEVGGYLFIKSVAGPVYTSSITNAAGGNNNEPHLYQWYNPLLFGAASQSVATEALATANTAKTTADQAIVDAAAAQSTADGAVTTANSAVTTANTAITNAATAQTTADGAVTTANNAAAAVASKATVPTKANATSVWTGSANQVLDSSITGGITSGTYILDIELNGTTTVFTVVMHVTELSTFIADIHSVFVGVGSSKLMSVEKRYSSPNHYFRCVEWTLSGTFTQTTSNKILQIWRVD